MDSMTFAELQAAVNGGAAALRSVALLQPAGGPGDKVFPPTYLKEGKADTKYAMEERQLDGQRVQTVLLDSVASQANRMEEALLTGIRAGRLAVPLVEVDFTCEPDLADLGRLSALQAPHRIADALLRDATLDGVPFRQSPIGKAVTDARVNHAAAMFAWCPTALLFGVWDSTGPKGGLGSKFQRAIVSEIIGVNAVAGVKTASRIDPTGIEKEGVDIFRAKDEGEQWTADPAAAVIEKGKPQLYAGRGKEAKPGKPASINHGNIPPKMDWDAGGVTFDHARQTVVISLPAIRKLRFPVAIDGTPLAPAAEAAAHTSIAALGLAAIAFGREVGFDLRSRAALVPSGPLTLEVVPRDGTPVRSFALTADDASRILADAVAAAEAAGLSWPVAPVRLKPAPKLVQLIRKSREKAAVAGEDAE